MIGELDYYTHGDAGVLDWFRDNKPVEEKGYTTQLIGNDAVKFINAQSAAKPFYLYLTFNAPHTPYQAPQEYIDRYKDIAGSDAPDLRGHGRLPRRRNRPRGRRARQEGIARQHADHLPQRQRRHAERDVRRVRWRTCRRSRFPATTARIATARARSSRAAAACARCANWPGHIKAETVDGIIHAVDIYPTLAALAGASTAKCKPLDGVNVWGTIAEGKPSPRTEVVYNVEPFRAAIRQGDWKLIWRTLIPTSVDLYNLAEDPSEKNNVAAAHPDKVAAMQARIDALGKEAAKPLALKYVASVGLAHGKPLLGSEGAKTPATAGDHGALDHRRRRRRLTPSPPRNPRTPSLTRNRRFAQIKDRLGRNAEVFTSRRNAKARRIYRLTFRTGLTDDTENADQKSFEFLAPPCGLCRPRSICGNLR